MRTVPPALQAKLDAGVATLCWCWRLTLADGAVLALTDHDQDLEVSGVTYRAASARMEAGLDAQAGLAPTTGRLQALLTLDGVVEEDLASGRLDGAAVEMLQVDWREPALQIRVAVGALGEITRADGGWTAELRGRAAALRRSIGRVVQRGCDADLGDARCGVDLSAPAYAADGAVTALNGAGFQSSGLDALAAGVLTLGQLEWTSGANVGRRARVIAHRRIDGVDHLELDQPMADPIAPGDGFAVRAGCDKRFATCRDRFANTLNFRGFPYVPGNDWLQRRAQDGDVNDGGSRGVAG